MRPDMTYSVYSFIRFSLTVLFCVLIFSMCDEKEQVVVAPLIDGTQLDFWRIDTLPSQGNPGGLHLFCMLVIDTNHIVVGGHGIGSVIKLIEFKEDSMINWSTSAGVYDLASAADGFYSCEHFFPGAVTYNLKGNKILYRTDNLDDIAYSIFRRSEGTYFVGVTRAGIYRFDGSTFKRDTIIARLNGSDRMFFFTDFAEHRGSNYAIALYYIRDGAEERGYLLKETSSRRWEYIDSCSYAWNESFDRPHFGTQKLHATKDGALFSIGAGGAFRMRDDETWESLVRMELGVGIGGTSSKDMYFGSNNGHFYYYDGTTVKEISIPTLSPKTMIAEIVVIGGKIFILTQDWGNNGSYLLRGERR
jgi:hypothetical protein